MPWTADRDQALLKQVQLRTDGDLTDKHIYRTQQVSWMQVQVLCLCTQLPHHRLVDHTLRTHSARIGVMTRRRASYCCGCFAAVVAAAEPRLSRDGCSGCLPSRVPATAATSSASAAAAAAAAADRAVQTVGFRPV